jgi:hypothetical protein
MNIEEANKISSDYAIFLMKKGVSILHGAPESILPYSKQKIKEALKKMVYAASVNNDAEALNGLAAAYQRLSFFLPDADINYNNKINKKIIELKIIKHKNELPKDSKLKIMIGLLAFELLALDNLFEKKIAYKLKKKSIEIFVDKLKLNKDDVQEKLELYWNKFKSSCKQKTFLNPTEIIGSLVLNDIGIENMSKKKNIDIIPSLYMQDILFKLSGRWKKVKERFDIQL